MQLDKGKFMGPRTRHIVKLYQPGLLSRREYRNIVLLMIDWCDENLTPGYKVYYCNRGERHSLWSFDDEADASSFQSEFGGDYSQQVKQGGNVAP
jgi:hypothetical protein